MKDNFVIEGLLFHALILAFAIFIGLKQVDLKVEVNVCEPTPKNEKPLDPENQGA